MKKQKLNEFQVFQEIKKKHIQDIFGENSPFEEETRDTAEILKQINELGFLTSNSQEGRIDYGDVPTNMVEYHTVFSKLYALQWREEAKYSKPHPHGLFFEQDPPEDLNFLTRDIINTHYQGGYKHGIVQSQRAYLSGYMETDLAEIFYHLFNLKTDKLCITSEHCEIPMTYALGGGLEYEPKQTYVKYLYDQLPHPTNMWPCDTECYRNRWKDEFQTTDLTSSTQEVNCIDMQHGRDTTSPDGLFTDVLKILIEANKIFAERS